MKLGEICSWNLMFLILSLSMGYHQNYLWEVRKVSLKNSPSELRQIMYILTQNSERQKEGYGCLHTEYGVPKEVYGSLRFGAG